MTTALIPDHTTIHAMVAEAEAHLASGRLDAAASIYEKVMPSMPGNADLHYVLGLVYLEQGLIEKALKQLCEAIRLSPGEPKILRGLGDAQTAAGDLMAATGAYQKVLAVDPHNTQVLVNLGNTWHAMDHLEQALDCFQKAAAIDPNSKRALNNLGKTYLDLNDLDQALVCLDQCLKIDPDYAEARFNRAVALLTIGDYVQGWREYEWRFKRKTAGQVYPHKLTSPRWQGEPFPDRCLLVHAEQGMGDMLQFVRYLPWVKQLGGRVILEAHPPLLPLLKALDCVDVVLPFDKHRPAPIEHDFHIPLVSLAAQYAVTTACIPVKVPYLRADKAKMAAWKKRIGDGGLRVGLVWSGSGLNPRRNLNLEDCRSWLQRPGIRFYALQKGVAAGQLPKSFADLPLTNLGDQLDDFSDTAAVMACLDLIISVDTAAAHLAGAMGLPTWVLLPFTTDWRWPQGRKARPWYPTVRTFRQGLRGDWSAVIRQVEKALGRLKAPARARQPNRTIGLDSDSAGEPENRQVRSTVEAGLQLLNEGNTEEAKVLFQLAVETQPADPVACYNLGLILQQSNELETAARYYLQALDAAPKFSQAMSNLGSVRLMQGMVEAAAGCFEQVVLMEPENAGSHYNLGNAHLARNEFLRAIESYQMALKLNPRHFKTLNNMGRAWHQLGQYDRSRSCLDRAIELHPDYAEAHLNRAVNALLLGAWEPGWQEYQWRFKCHNQHRVYPHRLVSPVWDGRHLAGQKILVHSEQGIGDAIQFCRYIPLIKACGGQIIFEVRKSLYPLFKTFKGVDELVTLSEHHANEDNCRWHLPLGNCPLIFHTTPHNVPAQTPYIFADPDKIRQWRRRLPAEGLHVGLVWSGNDTYRQRSCSLHDLAALTGIKGVNWIGLQKGPAAAMAEPDRRPAGFKLDNWGEDFQDFSDTAAAVANLDLIISIDTSVAHLAGAMGKPVWVMLPAVPDWRWMLHRSDSPWYPGMRLFRQPAQGQWKPVIQHIENRLQQLTSQLA